MTGQWSRAGVNSNTIGVQMELRGNPTAPNSYTYFVFDLYQLKDSNQWTKDLLANLVTPTFPSDPNLRAQNQQLVDKIHPDSCPWKICYALIPTEFHFNQPADQVITLAKGLSAAAVSNVKAAGATTSQHLLDLLKAAGGKPTNNGPAGMSLPEGPAVQDAIGCLQRNSADCQAPAGALDLLHQQHLDSNKKAASTVA